MKRKVRQGRKVYTEPSMWLGALILTVSWMAVMLMFHMNPFGHASHDSYTLQALAWREGKLSLGRDYPWLELAVFRNDWYVSFPPVPSLVMLPLTFLFGEDTPDTLVTGLYFLMSYFAAYSLARRARKPEDACFLALFMTMGCSLFDFSLTGDVWNQAQLLSFMLTSIFVLTITGTSPVGWGTGLACLALSVGCRPFQAVFVPFGLYRLYCNLREKKQGNIFLKMTPYLFLPALVAIGLAGYNYVRFGNPLEFGHNYLPEFTRDPEKPQISLQYVVHNVQNLLRLPYMKDGRLEFVRFDGFAFWLVNPIYVSMPIALLRRTIQRKADPADFLLVIAFAGEFFALLMHKTLGGWQFGARYLCDLIPMMFYVQIRGRSKMTYWEKMIAVFAIAINLYGSIVFRMMNMQI